MSRDRPVVTADDAAHYAYAREGNAHALYRYEGPRADLRGAYLRLLKRASTREDTGAWRCHPIDALVWNLDETTATWAAADARVRDAFFAIERDDRDASTSCAPSSWRDDLGVVRVERDALCALVDATMAADAFETARRGGRDGRTASARETVGQLSENAAETSEVFRRDEGDGTCVVEIKPKSFVGMMIEGRRTWRFRGHQRLKTRRGERAETSAYWPIDLLGDDDAVERACEALMRCPQNNLRIMRGGKTLVDDAGARVDDDDDDDARETLATVSRLLPRIVRDARDVFAFLFDRQRRGGDDDPATFRAVQELVRARTARRTNASLAPDVVDALRDFSLAQTAKDCGVLFTVRLRITDDDVRALAPPTRALSYTDTNGRARVCAYRPQIIDASLKSFAKTESWTRLAEDIAAAVDVDADGDRGREFSREMFETRPVVDLIRRLANDRAME